MPVRRINAADAAPWYALREYLVEAYSNPEMRALVELSLIAEAASRLPDERVPAHEYAAMLCTLIQRHSGVPSAEFWRQLATDRPLRQREIGRIRSAFSGSIREAAELQYTQRPAAGRRWGAVMQPILGIGGAFASVMVVSMVCTAQTPKSTTDTTPPVLEKSEHRIMCVDGTRSKNCSKVGPGCCSGHEGVAPGQK